MGRNTLINSQRKRILFISNDKKKGNKTEKNRKKNIQKENITDVSDFSENEIPDLNSLKPSEFEPKKPIEDTNVKGSDDEEEGMADKV